MVINTAGKQLGEMVYFSLGVIVYFYFQGSQGTDLRQELEAKAREECCLLAYWFFLQPFLIQHRPITRDGTIHYVLSPPMSISSQENTSQTCPQAILRETIPQKKFSLPRCI